MKHKLLNKLWLRVGIIVAVMTTALAGTAAAEDVTTTYRFTSKSWEAMIYGTDVVANWTSGKDGNQLTSGQGIQVTTGASGANGTSPVSYSNVSKVVVRYCTNASKGEGTIKVQVGSNSEQSFSVTKPSSGGTDLKDATFNYDTPETGNIKVTGECSTNSIYIYSVTITYSSGGGSTFSVTYNANGATGGSVPTDATAYSSGATVTVKGNTGSLVKAGYTFDGWNTQADGNGTNYTAGTGTFSISANTTLYAKWNAKTITGLSYTGTPTKTSYYDGEDFDPTGLTVTASFNDSSNDDVTTSVVWTPSPLTTGTTSVTGTYMGQTVNVTGLTVTAAPGSAENPYTVAQARAKIDTGSDLNGKYVHGIISQVDSYNDTYKSITYWISDDGTTTGQMEVYKGKGLNGADFSDVTDLEVGDRVIVYGNLTYYEKESVYEFSSGSQIKFLVEIQENDLAKTNDISLSMASPSTTADAKDYFTTSSSGTITYESGNTSVATVSAAGVVTPVAAGSTTITVTQAKTATYKAGEITINVTVSAASLNETEILIDASGSTAYGTPKVEDYVISDTYDGTIAAVSSNTDVATVAITQHTDGEGTFTITPVAVGTAVITISAPATATCEAADDVEYTITVNAPAGGTTAAVTSTVLFNETFDLCNGTGGRDDTYTGSVGTDGTSGKLDESWATIGSNGASQCIKLGTSGGTGSVTTSDISLTGAGTLTFSAAGWGDSKTNTVTVTATGATLSGDTDVTLTASTWKNYTVNITEATGTVAITFTMKRGFLDDVVVKDAGVDLSVTLNASGYATYCSEYPLDFTDSEDDGYSAWQITSVSGTTITFSQITGSIKGGQGILLKGEAGTTITIPSVNSSTNLSGNKLVGTLAPTYITTVVGDYTNFGLSGSSFVKINPGTIKANKAYLPVLTANLPSSVKAFTFIFEDDATGIRTVETVSAEEAAQIFNLAGQRISKMQKGINIVNGKKVLK